MFIGGESARDVMHDVRDKRALAA